MQTCEEFKKQIEDHSQELSQELNEYIIEREDTSARSVLNIIDERRPIEKATVDWIVQKIAAFEVLQSNTMEQLQVMINILNTRNETLAGTKKDEFDDLLLLIGMEHHNGKR